MPPHLPRLRGLFALALLLGSLAAALPGTRPAPPDPPRARLAVLVYFDQMRGDYLGRWRGLFGDGGFRRLQDEGAWYRDCHYPYAYTVTAAGHASVATGCSPDRHGVVGNDWYDRDAAAPVGCVADPRYGRVPAAAGAKGGGASPGRLLRPTLADALKDATGGRGRVVALSLKDRSAVLPGGQRPDACYWLDAGTGEFITSTYYRDAPHPWVAAFNRSRAADRWADATWDRLLPGLDYARHSGPDAGPGEGRGAGKGELAQGVTFPHPMEVGARKPADYYAALYNSPFGNDLLLALAERAVEAEGLGQDGVPDLLCLSFSSNDAVGHTWGPDSQEVLDVTLRSDRVVRDLLAFLDAKVGPGRYALALTADHGVCPLPEAARARGQEAARVPPDLVGSRAEEFLVERFGAAGGDRWVEATAGPWVYLNRALVGRAGRGRAEVEAALAGWLRGQAVVQAAYTRAELEGAAPAGDALAAAVRRSYHPGRCGDVFVVLKPYHLLSSPLGSGTTHGTPHAYDTHVPLLVSGPGVRPGTRPERVTPQAAAAALARMTGVPPPAGADAPPPPGLFGPP